MLHSPVPAWEVMKTDSNIDYTETKKRREFHILLQYLVKSHIADSYLNHLNIFTDGPILENEQAGAGFVMPGFKTGEEKKEGKKACTLEKQSLYFL